MNFLEKHYNLKKSNAIDNLKLDRYYSKICLNEFTNRSLNKSVRNVHEMKYWENMGLKYVWILKPLG